MQGSSLKVRDRIYLIRKQLRNFSTSICSLTTYSCYDQSQCIICMFAASAVAEVDQKEVEVDESLFQDFEDLELMEDTQT